jgi:enoyl-CoA hydratase
MQRNYKTLIADERDGILRITLNRPEKLNALCADLYAEMSQVLQDIQASSSVRVVIMTGAGRAFSAGGDLVELKQASGSVEAAQKRMHLSHNIAASMRRIRQPIIMAINGDAIGAGCTLALNGDLRIASDKARFGIMFIRLGLVPDLGGVYNLLRLTGIGKALELSLLGDLIDAREAMRVGLVNRIVLQEELSTIADQWAARISQSSELAVQLTKSAMYKGIHLDFFSELEDEINSQSLCMNSVHARQSMEAFQAKMNKEK